MLDDPNIIEDEPERDDHQLILFENLPKWTEHWVGMPEFHHKDLRPDKSVVVHFATELDRSIFSRIIGQKVTRDTISLWYPEAEIGRYAGCRRYRSTRDGSTKYPIYVISKGRHESRPTSRALESIGETYKIVIEPQEYEQYASVIDPEKILTLPFSNLGQGSIPARNWVWEHATASRSIRHWILDDNIDGFYRWNENMKTPVTGSSIFRAVEEFTDRYENVAISGMNYFKLVLRKEPRPPFTMNTRIYSCLLIDNSIKFRWRGRYNEDTDLCIRVLKSGLCTILFNAFLADKRTTMTMKGGNTDELYQDDGRLKMAESLRDQHPDIVKVTRKWGQWQHHVDYSGFKKNKLILKSGVVLPDGPDNFGMELEVDE